MLEQFFVRQANAPANPTSLSGGSVGRSSICEPEARGHAVEPLRRASSGRSAIRGSSAWTPAASSSGATTRGAPRMRRAIWDHGQAWAKVARSSGGSASVGSLSTGGNILPSVFAQACAAPSLATAPQPVGVSRREPGQVQPPRRLGASPTGRGSARPGGGDSGHPDCIGSPRPVCMVGERVGGRRLAGESQE